jgi:hypothetical protein
MRRHLGRQINLVVFGWVLDESLQLELILECELLIFVLNDKQLITFDDLLFIHESNWAVSKYSLLRVDNFSRLVGVQPDRNTLRGTEDNVVGESLWVRKEHLLLIFTLEVVEYELVQDTKFLILAAFHQLLGILPGDGAVVLELRDGGLQ